MRRTTTSERKQVFASNSKFQIESASDIIKGETKKLTKLVQQFCLNFSAYKHVRRKGHNSVEMLDP